MYQKATPLFMRCESPLHAGTGTVLGLVDLPIQREGHTGFPKVEASGLKGSLREAFDMIKSQGKLNDNDLDLMFGPEEGELHAGALGFSDARLLLFPVRSLKGVFAWATCPSVIRRLADDMKICGIDAQAVTSQPGKVCPGSELLVNGKVVLEEYALPADEDEKTSKLAQWLAGKLFAGDDYWKEKLKKSLIVLPDDDFAQFVELYTEVVTRNRIDPKTGIVVDGALFTEEYLPSESILYALALFSPVFSKDKGNFAGGADSVQKAFWDNLPEHFQLGGNATLGKGLIRIVK